MEEIRVCLLVFLIFLLRINFGYGSLPANGTVRLVDGQRASEGRVEVYINENWGTVCDDEWDLQDGKVVCVQLGYTNASKVRGGAYFGAGTGPIHYYGLDCVGDESNITQCPSFRRKDCKHSNDAGVECFPTSTSSPSGLLWALIVIPFVIIIFIIILTICIMLYKTFRYDRAQFEEEENQRRIRRFRGLTLHDQSMLATRGRKGIFARRRSDFLPSMSATSSVMERQNIPRAALGEGLAHPWQMTTSLEELETNIDDESDRSLYWAKSDPTVEAFNPTVMSTHDITEDNSSSVHRRRARDEDDEESSEFNPYEDEPDI